MSESQGMNINIGGAGITGAIRDALKNSGIKPPESKDFDTWKSIMDAIKGDENLKKVYTGSTDLRDKKSFWVAKACTVALSQTAWTKILNIVKPEPTEQTQDSRDVTGPDNPQITKETNFRKAFNLITQGIKDNKLGELPEGFNQALIQAYQKGDDSEGTPTVAEYVTSLLIDAQKILGKTDNMNRIMVQHAINGAVALCPDDNLYGRKCSEYSNNSIVEAFMDEHNIPENITIEPAQPPQIREVRFTEEQLKFKINDNIKPKLNEVLKGKVFDGPDGKKVTGEQILDIINKEDCFVYDARDFGSAQSLNNTQQIEINTNAVFSSESDAELMKLIIHEALHVAFDTKNGSTWEEERCCEAQAMQIAAEVVASEKDKEGSTFTSYSIYGQNIEAFNNHELLDKTMDTWLETNYANRPKNSNGDITIIKNTDLLTTEAINNGRNEYLKPENRIEIPHGAKIFVDGKEIGAIGQLRLESVLLTNEKGNSNICQLVNPDGLSKLGMVVFDDTVDHTGAEVPKTEPKIIEIKFGDTVIKGKIYN